MRELAKEGKDFSAKLDPKSPFPGCADFFLLSHTISFFAPHPLSSSYISFVAQIRRDGPTDETISFSNPRRFCCMLTADNFYHALHIPPFISDRFLNN